MLGLIERGNIVRLTFDDQISAVKGVSCRIKVAQLLQSFQLRKLGIRVATAQLVSMNESFCKVSCVKFIALFQSIKGAFLAFRLSDSTGDPSEGSSKPPAPVAALIICWETQHRELSIWKISFLGRGGK